MSADRRQPPPESDERSAYAPSTSPWEWFTAAVGLLLISVTVVYLAYVGLTRPDGPPSVDIEVVDVRRQEGQYLVRFRARNDGNSTAAALVVEGRLEEGGRVVENAQATIAYLPQRSVRQGGLFFSKDPSGHALSVSAVAYSTP